MIMDGNKRWSKINNVSLKEGYLKGFYNIKKIDVENYILEMALAGWKKSDVKVTVEDGVLSIAGKIKT